MSSLDVTSPLAIGPQDLSAVELIEVLRRRIASHQIPPGARLREQELAEEFGIPRTRVREAFLALDERGLIERVPNRGAVVARLDLDQLLDIYDVREVLEGLCARLATAQAPPGSWDDLVELFGAPMQSYVDEGDFDGFIDGYELFRQRIIDSAENPVLSSMLDTIYDKTQVAIRRLIILPDRAAVGLEEHRAVLAAMSSGQVELAEELRRQNMRSAKAYLIRFQSFVL